MDESHLNGGFGLSYEDLRSVEHGQQQQQQQQQKVQGTEIQRSGRRFKTVIWHFKALCSR